MSAFDDEFGLFGEGSDEPERRPTLGARKIAANETVIDEIEREERPPRRAPAPKRPPPPDRERKRRERSPGGVDPWAGHRRATGLLGFLARKLVAERD